MRSGSACLCLALLWQYASAMPKPEGLSRQERGASQHLMSNNGAAVSVLNK